MAENGRVEVKRGRFPSVPDVVVAVVCSHLTRKRKGRARLGAELHLGQWRLWTRTKISVQFEVFELSDWLTQLFKWIAEFCSFCHLHEEKPHHLQPFHGAGVSTEGNEIHCYETSLLFLECLKKENWILPFIILGKQEGYFWVFSSHLSESIRQGNYPFLIFLGRLNYFKLLWQRIWNISLRQ